ncbi:ABC transporter permease [Demequina sp. NBRC 110052]|uniref:ABC transporter permease n=1 Tax=Demequina sp. NBRC 110052 TaxID=1570341 RepID=UPI000A00FFFA|nr:ABC transporter permease [Demequina sp. NBRC 110052]
MIWLIARREYRTRALSKASLISSAVMIVLIVAAALIIRPFMTEDGAGDGVLVEVDAATAPLIPYLEVAASQQGIALMVEEVDAGASPELAEGVAGVLTGDPAQPQLFVDSAEGPVPVVTASAVQAYVLDAEVSGLGGDPAQVSEALASATPTVTVLGDQQDIDPGALFAGFAVIFVLFVVLIQSASVIMMGVVEEKSSRVVEILLATVKPATLLGGKVLGVGLYALTQAAGMLVPALFAIWYLDLVAEFGIDVGSLLLNFAVWFVLGFAIFIVLFGGLASLVSRQEDLGAVTTPMMLTMMVPLYLAIYLVPNNPDGPITAALTQVPFFAPFLVPMRVAFGAIAPWEIALAVVIALVSIPVLTWLAGRVYAGAVLNTGGRMKIRDAVRRG